MFTPDCLISTMYEGCFSEAINSSFGMGFKDVIHVPMLSKVIGQFWDSLDLS